MTPEEKAYRLAEERIAEAKAGGWKYLNISGSSPANSAICGGMRSSALKASSRSSKGMV